jgi:hypothetical protein
VAAQIAQKISRAAQFAIHNDSVEFGVGEAIAGGLRFRIHVNANPQITQNSTQNADCLPIVADHDGLESHS